LVEKSALANEPAVPRKKRSFKDTAGEFLMWLIIGPVVAVLAVMVAKAAGLPLWAVGGLLLVIGLVALSMLLKPNDRLPIGRGRAAGLMFAAMVGGGGLSPPTTTTDTLRSASAAAPTPSPNAESANRAVAEAGPATDVPKPPEPVAAPASAPVPPAPRTNWSYTSSKDEMRGTTTRFAMISSDNQLNFGFPYSRGAANLTVRQRPEDGLNIIVQVEGQFTCSSFTDDTVSVKFDDGPIRQYDCSTASDGSADTLFIRGAAGFLAKLQKAEKLIIEAEFFQQGRHQMVFSTNGLEW